jgi:uncharacterized protein
MVTIDIQTARRFILGKQGLWPGRRWRGLKGTEKAMSAIEYLQLDPLQVLARSQDITLQGRVLDYRLEMWEVPTYRKRRFFDWGSWLAVRPMEELPYWRRLMHYERDHNSHLQTLAHEHADTIAEMRTVLRERETVSNRDFEMSTRTRTQHYRGRKDSALALYYLWRTGEVMTHHRERFEWVYALTETVAPAQFIYESGEAETDRFLIAKEAAFNGLSRLSTTSVTLHRRLPDQAYHKKLLAAMLADGDLVEVKVESWKTMQYAPGTDEKLLQNLTAGRIPKAWKPLETTTTDEAVFLAPLEQVSARGRAKDLFGFDYVWEVYKPVSQRKFGYYTLPVLWGDRLVARFDSKLDRAANTFVILGFWLEDQALGRDPAFAEALAHGFARFLTFLGADRLAAKEISQPLLRKSAGSYIPS